MGVGRVICVALPFILTVGSLIFLLIAALGGVSNKDLYMFRVNLTDLEINPASVSSIVSRDALPKAVNFGTYHNRALLTASGENALSKAQTDGTQTSNITAADLGLDNLYDITLWGYCTTNSNGDKTCTKAKFDWASDYLNTTTLETIGTAAGRRIELPDEVTTALSAFKTATKWTQVAYIIAFIALGLEIVFGIFANCTRVMSCITFLVASVASLAVCASAALSTAMSVIVVGAVEGTAKFYGVSAGFNNSFLALIWISAALALGAGFFWMFTICCCAPNHTRKERKRQSDGEKLIPQSTSYQPIQEENGYYKQQQTAQYGAPRYASGARNDMAYEPYSHRS
ncbi:SUR7 family protein pun1-like protein 3 [Colletotrichum chlorophyti]|uniref:SUR7 family protein pun1-like protein 3 n=1 Tax=Colletotrichum chlorophyti TaxID=708187 RepID=A0A1Q8RJ89_9PEZI|nr:SUR7 family protein pun1-like protein 3 [Colletotrichum chlorophyti]